LIHRKKNIGSDEVVVDVKCGFAQIVIQDFWRQFLGENELITKSGEGNYINISRWPSFLYLDILAEAPVYPLEAIIQTRFLKAQSELKPAMQNDFPLLSVAESLAECQSIRAIGSTIS
jgi:hypothetical protein